MNMLLYNTTFSISPDKEKEFLQWLQEEFVASAVADGQYFRDPELFRIQSAVADGSVNYALHLRASSPEEIETWYEDHGSRLHSYILEHWQGDVMAFSTTLTAVK